jgi:hypothetical protein
MPAEFQTLTMRVKSVLRDPATGCITLALEMTDAKQRDFETCERAVIEGATVDVVVSLEV